MLCPVTAMGAYGANTGASTATNVRNASRPAPMGPVRVRQKLDHHSAALFPADLPDPAETCGDCTAALLTAASPEQPEGRFSRCRAGVRATVAVLVR